MTGEEEIIRETIVDIDGTLSDKEYNGYGNFYKYNKEYNVTVKVKL